MNLTTQNREITMDDPKCYPLVEIHVNKIRQNMDFAVRTCKEAGVDLAWVVKGFHGLPGLMQRLYPNSGCKYLASSRLNQLETAKQLNLPGPYMLIRIPMLSEISQLVRLAEYSLESEQIVVDAIEKECLRQNRTHWVVLMADLGDLREGIWNYDQLIQLAVHIERDLSQVKLAGVGVNLGCYGSVMATPEKMNDLIAIAERVEAQIGRKLDIISGGGSTSYPMITRGEMPKRINHLRMGEQIEIAYDAVAYHYFENACDFHQDTVLLKAEVIEVQDKPSYPVGQLSVDAFGNVGVYEDRGIRKRALLGVGKVDYGYLERMHCLTPGVELLGASSDHTILDIEDCKEEIKVGDILSFYLSYSQIAMLTSSPCVQICYAD